MNRQSGEARRAQILAIAMELFSAHGFDGTTTRAIAAAAKINEALIFHYFPTKLSLFQAVIVKYGVQSFGARYLDLPLDAPLSEVLSVYSNIFLNEVWNNRSAFRLLLGAAFSNKLANDDLTLLDQNIDKELNRLLTGYETAGVIMPGLAQPTAAVMSLALRGFIFVSIRNESADWDSIRTTFVENLTAVVMLSMQTRKY